VVATGICQYAVGQLSSFKDSSWLTIAGLYNAAAALLRIIIMIQELGIPIDHQTSPMIIQYRVQGADWVMLVVSRS
jgi:hypothetical protein